MQAVWLPASVAFAAAMIGRARLLPGVFLVSLVASYVLFSPPFHLAVLVSLGNALGPELAAALLRRLRPASGLFTRFAGVCAFVGCAVVLHPALTATAGLASLATAGGDPTAGVAARWARWWLSDSGGTLYLAPALLQWLGVERPSRAPGGVRRRDVSVWVGTALVGLALFVSPAPPQLPPEAVFLLAVPLSWLAVRTSLRAAYSLVTMVALVASAGTVAGQGPFHARAADNHLQVVGMMVVLFSMGVLTASFGVAALLPSDRALDELFERADRALYRAKAAGRDRVESLVDEDGTPEVSGVIERAGAAPRDRTGA